MKLPKVVGDLAPWTTEGFDTTSGVLSVGTDALGDTYALHPAMKAMHDLYLDGDLAVIPGVHYPYADYSHFRSEVIYYTGDPIGTSGLGWMGKYLDYSGFASTEVPAVMIDSEYSPLFTPTNTSLFAFNSLRELRFPSGSRTTQRSDAFRAMYAESGLSSEVDFPELVNIGNTGVAAIDTFAQYYAPGCSAAGKVEALLTDVDGCYDNSNPLVYTSPLNVDQNARLDGNGLADDLRHVAAVIRSNVGARFFHVGIGGFDTHSNQEQGFYHSYLLNRVSEAVGSFWNEMKNSGMTAPAGYGTYDTSDLSSKVLIVTFSEFGRTSKQNSDSASAAGTDHGRSAVQFVVGSTVTAGIHGQHPVLADPDLDDDMRPSHDMRDLFGTILDKWLNVPTSIIGPGPGKMFAATPTPDWLSNSYTTYTPIPFLP